MTAELLIPTFVEVIDRNNACWLATKIVFIDLLTARHFHKATFVHSTVKCRTNDTSPQAIRQELGCSCSAIGPHPAGTEHDEDVRVWFEQLVKQRGVLKQREFWRSMKIYASPGMPETFFVVQHTVIVQIKDLAAVADWNIFQESATAVNTWAVSSNHPRRKSRFL